MRTEDFFEEKNRAIEIYWKSRGFVFDKIYDWLFTFVRKRGVISAVDFTTRHLNVECFESAVPAIFLSYAPTFYAIVSSSYEWRILQFFNDNCIVFIWEKNSSILQWQLYRLHMNDRSILQFFTDNCIVFIWVKSS